MKQELVGRSGPDYALCRYGLSRMTYRGPQRPLDGRFVAFLGGTETFGKFLETPYPDMVESLTGEVCVNFGAVNAGLDLYTRDSAVQAAAHDALATVIQVPGVQNQSNRFYTVHPRRNDRFLRPTAALETLYPDIDFADIVFTRHLLFALQDRCGERFNLVRSELQANWVCRMRALLDKIGGPKLLFWFSELRPELSAAQQDVLHADPLFVTRSMVDELVSDDVAFCAVVPDGQQGADRCEGMVFHPMERQAAEEMLGLQAHEQAADVLVDQLAELLGQEW